MIRCRAFQPSRFKTALGMRSSWIKPRRERKGKQHCKEIGTLSVKYVAELLDLCGDRISLLVPCFGPYQVWFKKMSTFSWFYGFLFFQKSCRTDWTGWPGAFGAMGPQSCCRSHHNQVRANISVTKRQVIGKIQTLTMFLHVHHMHMYVFIYLVIPWYFRGLALEEAPVPQAGSKICGC